MAIVRISWQKINENGRFEWIRKLNSTSSSYYMKIVGIHDGELYLQLSILGYNSLILLEPDYFLTPKSNCNYLIKYDTSGNIKWGKRGFTYRR